MVTDLGCAAPQNHQAIRLTRSLHVLFQASMISHEDSAFTQSTNARPRLLCQNKSPSNVASVERLSIEIASTLHSIFAAALSTSRLGSFHDQSLA